MFEGVRKVFIKVIILVLFSTITMYLNILFKNKLSQTKKKKILVLLYMPYDGAENNEVLLVLQFTFLFG